MSCRGLLHCCTLPEGSSIAVVLLIGTGLALRLISNSFPTAGTLSTEWRGGVCSRGTARTEELSWGEVRHSQTRCVGIPLRGGNEGLVMWFPSDTKLYRARITDIDTDSFYYWKQLMYFHVGERSVSWWKDHLNDMAKFRHHMLKHRTVLKEK